MNIGIIGRYGGSVGSAHADFDQVIMSLINVLKDHEIFLYTDTHRSLSETYSTVAKGRTTTASIGTIGEICTHVIAVGGDGTMLGAARDLARYHTKLIGVNMGRVGFITDISKTELEKVNEILDGRGSQEDRNFLAVSELGGSLRGIALNEILLKAHGAKVVEFEVHLNGHYAYKVQGDGLMISTPTGSTAYALSTGGPILNPTAKVLEIIPVLPQTLSHRPLIVKDDSEICVKLIKGRFDVFADGIGLGFFESSEVSDLNPEWTIKQSTDHYVTFLHPESYCYLETLRQKLNWHLEPGTK